MDLATPLDFIKISPFGSRAVGCAKEDSDYDYLVLVRKRPSHGDAIVSGFSVDDKNALYGPIFSSWRKDNVNLVFTDSEDFFNVTLEATEFCAKHKVFDKADRIRVHESFREHIFTKELFLPKRFPLD